MKRETPRPSRRTFLSATAAGLLGGGFVRTSSAEPAITSGLPAPAGRVRSCIVLRMEGGASHIDLFDPKPQLARLHGQALPESLRRSAAPGFVPAEARLMRSPWGSRRYGACGMELSELLPGIGAHADDLVLIRSMYTDACNHLAARERIALTTAEPVSSPPVLAHESPQTRAAYGLDRRSQDARRFAEKCLAARQMVERGHPHVLVTLPGWDHHQNLARGLRTQCEIVDQPVAALLSDLRGRGLLENTLVVWLSEFGRSPLSEATRHGAAGPGRDHHPGAFSAWLAGAGIAGGRVIGRTDDFGWSIVESPIAACDLSSAVAHLVPENPVTELTHGGRRLLHRLLA